MWAKIIVVINLLWQSIFLAGSIESFVITKPYYPERNFFSFGYLWPSLLWSISFLANLFLLIYLFRLKNNAKRKIYIFFALLLTITPIIFGQILSRYYTLQAIDWIRSNIP
jgi:uncharacterized BrkB/YihY/UPF0761 family membrane protein